MTLMITEAWIRERVQLSHDNLEDVRSLALPGTYQEKVTSLGNSLSSFTRLKQLDLSRNALQSLHGLQHLTLLEKLNLYYNNITSLKELNLLRHNASLQELDLRLNPVTKNEPDYRLYLVHMLPNLRKLDDRSIRDSERKSALLHFDTDQAAGLSEYAMLPRREKGRSELPRTQHVRGLATRAGALDEDDSDLLDLLARTDGDLTKPQPITGSGVENPSVDIQTTQNLPRYAVGQQPYGVRTPTRGRSGPDGSRHHAERDANTYQPAEPSQHLPDLARPRPQGHQRLAGLDEERVDSNLKYTDETDAYSAYSTKVNFTLNPKSGDTRPETTWSASSASFDMHPTEEPSDTYGEPPPVQRVTKQAQPQGSGAVAPSIDQGVFLDGLLTLVDRYWNGSRSLHTNAKFQAQAQSLVDKLVADASTTSQEHMDRLQVDVARYAQENVSLRTKLSSSGRPAAQAFGGMELQRALEKAQKDVEILRKQLQQSIEQNRQLQTQLETSRTASDTKSNTGLDSHVDVNRDGDKLQRENNTLRLQVKHFSQLQELASMLQESHKSLVTTNDHLLKELEETKQRHIEEVKQLHWSYNQLKQTMGIVPQSQTPGKLNGYATMGEHSPGYSVGSKLAGHMQGFGYSNGSM